MFIFMLYFYYKEINMKEEKIIGKNKYVLSFYDDFEGDKLDNTKWRHCGEQHRQDRDCWWRDDCVKLDGKSNLIIESRVAKDKTHESGAIETRDRFTQAYGYFECKFKVEKEPGYWSAFWLFSDLVYEEDKDSSYACEIDIFEHVAAIDMYACNMHWNGYGEKHKKTGNKYWIDDSFYDDYHVGALEWNKDIYNFYLDGKLIYSTVAEGICKNPLHIVLSSEFGSWGKDPINSKLPGLFIVDYVKVYELQA